MNYNLRWVEYKLKRSDFFQSEVQLGRLLKWINSRQRISETELMNENIRIPTVTLR